MRYITAREAAEKWKVSKRLVQKYCAQGRITGVKRFGTSWGIPADAEKPTDPRKEKEKAKEGLFHDQEGDVGDFLPLMQAFFSPGMCGQYINAIQEESRQRIALGEYYYYTGQCEKAVKVVKPYLLADSLSLYLSATIIYTFANLSIGNISETRTGLRRLQSLTKENQNKSPGVQALIDFSKDICYVLTHQSIPVEKSVFREYMIRLPVSLRPLALYTCAHALCLQEKYARSVGVAEATLMMEEQLGVVGKIYLHLVCVMAYGRLKEMEQARCHMHKAWALANPDGFYQSFGQRHGLLCGMLEAEVRPFFPDAFQEVVKISRNFLAGWRKFHHVDTPDVVKEPLTPTEFFVASLVANGWKNQEIADYMGVSIHTVKSHVSDILQKLHIAKRSQIRLFHLN